MDRNAAIAELPEAYATALRLRDENVDDETIAARLGLEVEAVAPLLRIAVAKLDRVLRSQRVAPSTPSHHQKGRSMARVMFRIPHLHIGQVRSPDTDTDVVTLAVKVGDQIFPPVTKRIGDVGVGDHAVNLEVGPVEVGDADPVTVSLIVANMGYDASDEAYALKLMNTLSDAAAAVLTALYGAGAAWQELNKATKWINGLLTANCDGLVAQDQYVLTGADLAGLAPQTRDYPGTNTPDGCGANSNYQVTWDARTVDAEYAQGVLGAVGHPVALAGYFGPRDHYQHVIALTGDGAVNEFYFAGGGKPIGQDVIRQYPQARAVAGYYAPSDHYQHVIVATNDGNLHEEWFAGGGGASGSDVLMNIPGVRALAGYHSPRDGFQHVIAAADDGSVHEMFFPGGGAAPVQNVRGRFADIVAIGAYFCPIDNYEHIIVATRDGTITELWFGGADAGGSGVLAVVPGVTALCAYFSPEDQHQHVLAADATGTLHETWFIGGGRAMGHNIRGQVPGTIALAGYDGTGDHFEHVIAASSDGTLHELFWTP